MVRRNTPGKKQPTDTETARTTKVLLEQLDSQMKTVLDAVTGAEQRLGAKLDALHARLTGRIDELLDFVRRDRGTSGP